MTVIIAGERSGVGKTTITLSILAFLAKQNLKTQSFKVGPDYIDPMFHRAITGNYCRNLDPILTSENYVESSYHNQINSVNYAVIEGVMGLFDGVFFPDYIAQKTPSLINDYGSTAHLARLLQLPVILVVDCSKLSNSVAAIIHGFQSFDPQVKIKGVILNKVGSDRHLQLLENAVKNLELEIIGVFKRQEEIRIPDRHLGLIPTGELTNFQQIVDRLAHLAQTSLNWEKLLPLLKVESVKVTPTIISKNKQIKIGIAQDQAFNFYYQDNLDILSQLGAELIPFSPLQDPQLPPQIHGLYFGGGFPEIFAKILSENKSLKKQLTTLIKQGLPCYAECGGLMYLGDKLIDFEGKQWSMLGVIPTSTEMGEKLTLGYRQATVLQDSILLKKNAQVWGHEFHRSRSINDNKKPLFNLQTLYNQALIPEGWKIKNIHASYLHLHWGEHSNLPRRWLNFCENFKEKNLPIL